MKIVFIDAYTANPGDLPWEPFEKLGELTVFERSTDDEVIARCLEAEAVLTNKVKFTRKQIDQLPKLKYIGITATGTNIVDLEYAAQKGIQVTNVPGYSTDSVAQHVIAMILHFSSRIAEHSQAVFNGDWVNSKDFCFTLGTLSELSGKTLGIVGLGSIGQKTALIASAMGMKICAAHQSSMNRLELPYEVTWLPVDEVFKQSDFLSLHCPLTPETENLVNEQRLNSMKTNAVIINTGRGPLIDEAALSNALKNNVIAGAALDVLSTAPPAPDNPMLSAPNCIITPHIAWASYEARNRLLTTVAANIDSYKKGSTENLVN